jgi:hypothetical protein
MKFFTTNKLITICLALFAMILLVSAAAGFAGCNIYKFRDISIPDTIRTVRINHIDNHAQYVNPQLSPRLSDRLRQKIVGQTRLSQTNSDNADWDITGYISEYTLSTSAISGQREATNRLTVTVHLAKYDRKADKNEEFNVSRQFEFSATQSLQQAENALAEDMIKALADEIFNRLFSNW